MQPKPNIPRVHSAKKINEDRILLTWSGDVIDGAVKAAHRHCLAIHVTNQSIEVEGWFVVDLVRTLHERGKDGDVETTVEAELSRLRLE